MISKNIKKLFAILAFLGLIFALYKLFFEEKRIFSKNLEYNKIILLNNNGLIFKTSTSTNLVSDFLKEKNITLGEHDEIIPGLKNRIFSGTKIEIQRTIDIEIKVDGKIIKNYTLSKKVSNVLQENNITLSKLDQVSPNLSHPPNEKIIVTRINVEEKTEEERIDFKTIQKKDSKLGWREKKIEQHGERGIREILWKIIYKNGKEVSRVALSKKITKEPVEQIETQGTYMKLGKSQKGQGTWYAYKGGMFAASTTIPKGSYAKVTNTANRKSIIVQINDYGPQGKGRVIDLDKVAFQKIAPLNVGVIGVKVEEILN